MYLLRRYPTAMTAQYQNPLMIGMTTLTVTTEAYATVALSNSGVLLDAKTAGSDGVVNLAFSALSAPGYLDIVITKQNRQPYISTIQVILLPAGLMLFMFPILSVIRCLPETTMEPWITAKPIRFPSRLRMSASKQQPGVNATLSATDSCITITDNTATYGDIAPDQIGDGDNGFSLNVANNIADQHVVTFDLTDYKRNQFLDFAFQHYGQRSRTGNRHHDGIRSNTGRE